MEKVAKSRQIFDDLREKVLTTTRTSDALAQKLESVQREAESLRKELKEAQEKQEKFIEREVKNNERLLRLQVEYMDKEKRLEDKLVASRTYRKFDLMIDIVQSGSDPKLRNSAREKWQVRQCTFGVTLTFIPLFIRIDSLPQSINHDLHQKVKEESPSPNPASSRTSLIYEVGWIENQPSLLYPTNPSEQKETSLDDLSRELEEEKERRRRLESQCSKV